MRDTENTDQTAALLKVLNDQVESLKLEKGALIDREKQNCDLLATVSHEIRTPIGAIVSMVELLETTNLNETQSHYTRTLALAAQNLSTLTNDLLSFAKLEADQIDLEPQNFNLETFIETLSTSIMPRAEAKSLEFKTEIAPDCPTELYSDPVRLSQIINNLSNNALKFTEKGSLSLKVTTTELNEEDCTLRISLTDTGIGINEQEKAKIFAPFGQANLAINSTYGGSGLGLWIARKLATLMGGELDCVSEPQIGSTFWFSFKAKIAQASQASTSVEITEGLTGHALIVEDNALNQMLIKTYLDNFGLSNDTVSNGVEALEAVANNQYDIILMDMMMPVMDGMTATEELHKRWDETTKVPILALSANVLDDQIQKYLDAGMSGFVSKPIRAKKFYAALEELLHLDTCKRRSA